MNDLHAGLTYPFDPWHLQHGANYGESSKEHDDGWKEATEEHNKAIQLHDHACKHPPQEHY